MCAHPSEFAIMCIPYMTLYIGQGFSKVICDTVLFEISTLWVCIFANALWPGEKLVPSLCGFLFGVSCKWCDSIGAIEYIAHVFYMSVSVHAFFFYLAFYERTWVQASANSKCSVSYITFILSVSKKLGYIKKHVFCFQLLSALEKQRRKHLNTDQPVLYS